MKINTAVAIRINSILTEKGMTKYRLAEKAAISHDTLKTIFRERNDGINLKTVLLIIHGLDMTATEFFDDRIFDYANLDFD